MDSDTLWLGWFPALLVAAFVAIMIVVYVAQMEKAPGWVKRTAFRIRLLYKWSLYVLGFLVVVFGILPLVFHEGAMWLAPEHKFGYAGKYELSEDKIFVEPMPHDCEWDKAPIGRKYCHFGKSVTTVKDSRGKVAAVFVSWEKVQE
jgi:hypothetical protein